MRRLRTLLLAVLVATTAASFPASEGAAAPSTPAFGADIDAYSVYEGQAGCEPAPKPGVQDFHDIVLASYPGSGDYGISRDCAVGGQSEHKEGRAWDWKVLATDPAQKAMADDLLNWLLATDNWGNPHAMARRFGIMYIIWNGRMWRAYRPADGWQPYSGSNPHTDHVHFSFGWPGALRQTTWWTGVRDGILPYPGFGGGVSVASGRVRGSGAEADVVTGAGAGGGPHVRVLRVDGSEVTGFFAYPAGFRGGVNVAVADWDGDMSPEVATGAGAGGGPHVRILDPVDLREEFGFYAYSPGFGGGVRVAGGSFDGDWDAEIVSAPGPGGGPHVRVFDHTPAGSLTELAGFMAYGAGFSGGVNVAACNVDGIGGDEVITGAGPGGGPHTRILTVDAGGVYELAGFFAYAPNFSGGVNVACGDVDGDGRGEVITTPQSNGGPHVRVFGYAGGTVSEKYAFYATSPYMGAGLSVAAGPILGGPNAKVVAGFGPRSESRVVLREPTGAQIQG